MKQNGNVVLIVILGVAFILVAAGAYYFGMQKNSSPLVSNPQTTATSQPTVIPTTADPTANWQTYTNAQYKFSIQYPQNWALVPFATPDIIPGLKPSEDPDYSQPYYSDFGMREGCTLNFNPQAPFDEWVKANAGQEVQGYNSVKSSSAVTTGSGVSGVKVVWNIAGPGPGTNAQVVYIKLPQAVSGNNCLEFTYGKDKYFSIEDQIINTFKFTI